MKKTNISCPVCGDTPHEIVYKPWNVIDDPSQLYGAASGVPGTQFIVQCSSCNMIYENPRYPDDVILQAYMSSNEEGHDSQYPLRVESFYKSLKSLKKHIPKAGARVLDIGTAGGAFLDAANKFGYEYIGIEPSIYLVEQGKKRGLNIVQGTIFEHPFEDESFDMICLWDVIEHLTDPKGALLKVKPLLKENGVLLINYPDIGTWQAKIAGRHFWWILSVHLHHFTRETISKICENTGYNGIYFQRYWQILQLGYLQDMAIHYKIPLSALLKKITPNVIKNISIPYYASQTTVIVKVK